MNRIEASWQALLEWFNANQPDAVATLRAPATDSELDQFASAIGLSLPEDFKALYRITDGSDVEIPSVFDDGHWFLPLEHGLEFFNAWKVTADERPLDDFASWRKSIEDNVITVVGPVKPHPFSVQWIPLSSSNGDLHRFIDLDPAPGGTVGQVIEVYPENCSHAVLAPDLATYIEDYVAKLQAGRYKLEYECLTDTIPPPDVNGVLPDYLKAADSAALDDGAVAAPGNDTFEGEMGQLGSTGEEVFFTLHPDDGSELTCIATRKDTRGYSNIAIEQRARIRIQRCRPPRTHFLGAADYLVLEYKVLSRQGGR